MSQETPNPFSLPGMTAAFMNTPNNPLLTSMDMMRQAMGNMGYGTQSSAADSMVNPMAPEELEKRIADLRVVENWLKLNLSMLSSTIQGMEVQLATVKTLQSFVAMGQSAGQSNAVDASPLEIALGLKPAPKKAATAKKTASASQTQPDAATASNTANPQQAAAQGWWDMLENQFAQIAAATANAAKMSNEALQKTAEAGSMASAPNKRSTTKARAAKKSTRATRVPKKEA
ncbi:PhaM family polyhydroxyalkanoate granule multifunctional regulatory protein [Orrella daihaiensis]|uniref:Transcriptional regulator n=1 Tax=Orrella daihaiensis TaxID=2782176 RepID=A0ABY4AKI0_9BURK|nr:PhaM family polyhydroxyalkanoate granule multifunctional regulatory protein [Orrella daihaiensis]UOD50588.1 transcriptional regulator [Orrella daihaiensis]